MLIRFDVSAEGLPAVTAISLRSRTARVAEMGPRGGPSILRLAGRPLMFISID